MVRTTLINCLSMCSERRPSKAVLALSAMNNFGSPISPLGGSAMIPRSAILLLAICCGCATATRVVDDYDWPPDRFEIGFPSRNWQLVSHLSGGNEVHMTYRPYNIFGSNQREAVSISFYSPRFVGQPMSAEAVFMGVTNWLGRDGGLTVSIIERADDAIIYRWSLKAAGGIDRVVAGRRGLYRLQYSRSSGPLSVKQERTWLPIIKNARLAHKAT